MILILKVALKPPKNDVLKIISSQISQNETIISSIISIFWPIIKCVILKDALKTPKNDVFKTISSQISQNGAIISSITYFEFLGDNQA